MIKVRQLEAFNAVMLTGTVTAAAATLKISQPAISELISALEEQLGFALFFREKNRLQPTNEAHYLHETAIAALDGLATVNRVAEDIRNANAGTLRIAAMPMLALEFLPRIASSMLQRHGDVNVVLQARSSPTVVKLIATQQFDIGFAESDFDTGWMDAQRLRLPCVCILPANSPLAKKSVLEPEDLSHFPMVTAPLGHVRTKRLEALFTERGCTLNVKVETPLFASMCAFVAGGYGYSIVDAVTAHSAVRHDVVMRKFAPSFFTDFAVLFPTGKPRSIISEEFMKGVMRELEALGVQTNPV
ncbi:LysR substrate-binding domain-containing protein [Ottowia caeni]|uniref:LysR substrate-binding domain-containing protein n=1 Tax=Ottowia caeni TaxID=2870339 RepID=UPI001E3D965C|nr:LysR family transcriptional regulator [Ottowia caeni]